jgi:hypothetical protein
LTGKKARRRESETERERFGERGRATQWWEKTAWVDLTVGLNQQHLRMF